MALGTTLLTPVIGWVASVGRGYLPAVGAVIVLLAVTQVAVLLGSGGWFPFAVPGLLAVAATDAVPVPTAAQLALVPLTGVLGAWATVRWWGRAEAV